MEPLYIYKIVWVVSESAAYYLESLYHRKHVGHRLYLEDWTGSTETFESDVDSFDDFINEHKTFIDKLKTEEPPKYTLKYKPYYDSYEIGGVWYPNKKSIRNRLKISDVSIDNYLSGKQTMQDILNPRQHYYNGVCGSSLEELCLKLRISINALHNRKQKGMNIDDAIYDLLNNPSSERISSVIVDGVKMSLKAMWETFGLKSKIANNAFLKLNKDVYAVLNKYGIKTNKTIELIRMFDN